MAANTKPGALGTNPSTHKNAQGQWVNAQGQRVNGYGKVIQTSGTGNGGNSRNGSKGDVNLTPVNKVVKQSPQDQLKSLGTSAAAMGEKAMIGGMQYDPNNPMAQWNPQFAQYAEKAQQSVMDQFNRTMQPQFDRESADFQQRMAEQGIDPNSGRYKSEYQNMMQAQNNMRSNAMDTAYQTGMGAQQQAFNQNQQAQMTPFEFAQATNPYWELPYKTQADIMQQQMANKTSLGVANIGANASKFGAVVGAMGNNQYQQSPSLTNSVIQGLGSTIPYWFMGS